MKRAVHRFGIAFDVDGVLFRSPSVLPFANAVLRKLQDHKVPHIFLTNGGGKMESSKALEMSEQYEVPITPQQICMAHTPMRGMVHRHEDELVLVVGKKSDELKKIAQSYGCKKVASLDEYHAAHPLLYPDIEPDSSLQLESYLDEPVGAVLACIDPLLWGRDIQLICDVLRSDGIPGNLVDEQQIPFYNSCSDFEYAAQFPVPRLGAGSFSYALSTLFERVHGKPLRSIQFGKPEAISYHYAETLMDNIADELGVPHVERCYMIGDNPLTDIQGATRAGEKWTSILVKTGMHEDQDNHHIYPADAFLENAQDAIEWILEREATLE